MQSHLICKPQHLYIGPHFWPYCETKFEAQVEIEVKTEAETVAESEVHIEAQSSSKLARNVECTPQRCTVAEKVENAS